MNRRIRIVLPMLLLATLLLGCGFVGFGKEAGHENANNKPGFDERGIAYSEAETQASAPAKLEEIFISGSGMAVFNGGKPATWKVDRPLRIREFWTYHWNEEKGAPGGTIYLKKPDGTTVAEFPVNRTEPGQGGVPNAYWVADIDFKLEPGTYVVSDSDPATWAQNEETHGIGMAWVKVEKK